MNVEAKTKRQEKKRLKTLLQYLFVAAILFLIWSVGKYMQRPLLTMEDFQAGMAEKGFELTEFTEMASYEGYESATGAELGSMNFEYYRMDSKQSARWFIQNAVIWIEDEYTAESISSSDFSNSRREFLLGSDDYFIVWQFDNMVLYASADIQDKDSLKEIAKEIMPASLTGVWLLFIAGGILFGVAIGFMKQERNKRSRCNVPAAATVVGNVRKDTRSQTSSYCPVLAYYADGQMLEVTYGNGFAAPIEEGTEIDVNYDSDNPKEVYFADKKHERPFLIAASVFALLGLSLIALAVILL